MRHHTLLGNRPPNIEEVEQRLRGRRSADDMLIGLSIPPVYGERRAGWTNALAFRTISMAITYSPEPILIIDHYNTRRANELLAMRVGQIIQLTQLRGMDINKSTLTLTYDPTRR